MTYDPASANPLAGNPLKTREDMSRALHDLFDPLLPYFSEGNARVRLDGAGAHFDRAAADLEGFARPLWGLAPLGAGRRRFRPLAPLCRGPRQRNRSRSPGILGHGQRPRPAHGGTGGARLCTRAGAGQDLGAAWRRARANVVAYLKHARQFDYADNNWKFFRIFVDIALDRVGADFDRSLTKQYLEELEGFYVGDGWYRDGNVRRVDHYIPFAMHFYGLIYSKLVDDDYAKRYRERAVLFAKDFRTLVRAGWRHDSVRPQPDLSVRLRRFLVGARLRRSGGAALGRGQASLPRSICAGGGTSRSPAGTASCRSASAIRTC